MTFDDLMRKVLEILPDAQLDEDLDGQIVVYTNLRERLVDGKSEIVQFDGHEEEQ